MAETPPVVYQRSYDPEFSKSNKTDVVLVVQQYRYHVNRAVLSFHSDYFKTLFENNTTMEEIEIEHIDVDEFVDVLRLVHGFPLEELQEFSGDFGIRVLFELADRLDLPAAKRHLELLLMQSDLRGVERIKLAEKYQLNELLDHELLKYKEKADYLESSNLFKCFSEETNVKLFHRLLEMEGEIEKTPAPTPSVNIFETTLTKSDKTDAILVVDGKKLHVNKAVLSYYSDYFDTLFNSDFKEKSLEEIEIKDVDFEAFATLLSFVHIYPVMPTKANAESVLELAERFLMFSIMDHLEWLITILDIDHLEKIRIGEKFKLAVLLENGIDNMMKPQFKNLTEKAVYKGFSSKTKTKLFHRYLKI